MELGVVAGLKNGELSDDCMNDKRYQNKDVWLLLVTEQQLIICTCSAMTGHVQIVSCSSVTNDNHVSLFCAAYLDSTGFCCQSLAQCWLRPARSG